MLKVVTFFSEKGGVGKTTMTVLFASYLKYFKKEPVYVFDFDPSYRLCEIRSVDEELAKDPKNLTLIRSMALNLPYPVKQGVGETLSKEQAAQIVQEMRRIKESRDGYLLCDFPGRFLSSDASYVMIKAGLVDSIIFLADSDRQSINSVKATSTTIKQLTTQKPGGQQMCVLWNRETRQERTGNRDWYEKFSTMFEQKGISVISEKMHDILLARRDSDVFGFIRSTLCWPEANIARACPNIYRMFDEIKEKIDAVDGNLENALNSKATF